MITYTSDPCTCKAEAGLGYPGSLRPNWAAFKMSFKDNSHCRASKVPASALASPDLLIAPGREKLVLWLPRGLGRLHHRYCLVPESENCLVSSRWLEAKLLRNKSTLARNHLHI